MTAGQKQLLRALPVALLFVAGLIVQAMQTREEVSREEMNREEPAALTSSPDIRPHVQKMQAALVVQSLLPIERQLEKDEEFVRKTEAIYRSNAEETPVELPEKRPNFAQGWMKRPARRSRRFGSGWSFSMGRWTHITPTPTGCA